jgi:hypothetical protein
MHEVLEASAISLSRYVLGEMLRLRWFSEVVMIDTIIGCSLRRRNRVVYGMGSLLEGGTWLRNRGMSYYGWRVTIPLQGQYN